METIESLQAEISALKKQWEEHCEHCLEGEVERQKELISALKAELEASHVRETSIGRRWDKVSDKLAMEERRYKDFSDQHFEALKNLDNMQARALKAESQLTASKKLIEAKDELLVCYRLGKRPSEALFTKLEKAKETLDQLNKMGDV